VKDVSFFFSDTDIHIVSLSLFPQFNHGTFLCILGDARWQVTLLTR